MEPLQEAKTVSLGLRLNNNQLDGKEWLLPGLVRGLKNTLQELELQFDGGLHAKHVEIDFPPNLIETFILHDNLGSMTDDPRLRPNIVSLVEKIIEPNAFKIKNLTIFAFRRNLKTITEFLRKIDSSHLRSLTLTLDGSQEASDPSYQASHLAFYQTLGTFLLLT